MRIEEGWNCRRVGRHSPDPMGDHSRHLERQKHDRHVCYVSAFQYPSIYVEVYHGYMSKGDWRKPRTKVPCMVVEPSWMDPVRLECCVDGAIARARFLLASWERQSADSDDGGDL